MAQANNFLVVNGVNCIPPSALAWSKNDISGENAGRTADLIMHKERLGSKRKLALTWNGVTDAQVSSILNMFDPEYVQVTYHDAQSNSRQTRTFYTGDMNAQMYSWAYGKHLYKSLSFNIIEQ